MKQKFKWLLALVAMVASVNLMAADPVVLFHETFGDNSGSARAWSDDYSVKSGVALISGQTSGNTAYVITEAKQSKNTMGSVKSGLVGTAGKTMSFIVGPLNTSDYKSLSLSFYFGATKSWETTKSFVRVSYSTNGSNFTNLSRTDNNGNPTAAVSSNSKYVNAIYSFNEGVSSNTLYIKIEGYYYQTDKNGKEIGQVYLDEVDLTGIEAESTVKATVLANPTTAGSVSAEDGEGNPVTSETELNPEDIIIVTAEETNDDYYFYNWTLGAGDDAEIEEATNATTDVMMGSKDATITANFFPWANLTVAPTSKDLELPLASADGSFEVTVTSDQDVAFADYLEAIITSGDGENAIVLASTETTYGKSTTYVIDYEFTAAGDYVATIEFTGTDNQSKAANSATLTINASVKDLEPLDAPVVEAAKTAKSVTLTWADVEHAQGYTVAWNGGEAESATSGWTKEGLTAGTEYTYVVTAVGDGTTYLSNYTEGSVFTTAKKAVGIKDPVFVKAGGKYIVGETLSKNDFTVTQVYNDDTEESGKEVTYAYVDNKDEGAYVFTEADATAGSKTIKLKFSTYEIEKEVTVESFPKYTVKFSVPSCITAVPDAKVNQGSALDLTGITTEDPSLEGYSFAGWSTSSIVEGSTSGKLITSYTPTADNTTLYAVYKYDKTTGTEGWSETDLASLATTDIILITATANNTLYGIDNTSSSASPTAVAIAMNETAIAGTQDAKLKWTVSGDATNGYTFHAAGAEPDRWLYESTTSDSKNNDKIRVGSPTSGTNRNKWIVENGTSGETYLATKDNYTKRYLSLYATTPDWRGYLNTSNGVPNIKYYKYQAGGDVYKYTSTIDCSEPHTITVPESVTGGTVSADPTSAKAGATITVTYAPAQDYTVGTLTWTAEGGEAQDLNPVYGTTEYTFTMPDANVTIAATFAAIEYVTINWVIDGAAPQPKQEVKGAQVTPPAEPETCNDAIKFMGWTASSTITSKPADLFNDADAPLATEDKTYYSVYAQEDEGTQPAAEAFYTATFTRLTNETENYQSYATAHEFTSGTISWSVTGNQDFASNYVRIGGKHTENTNRVTNTTTKMGSKIAKIVINHAGKSSDNFTLNSIKLDVASDADFVNILATKTLTPSISTNTAGAIEFTPEVGTVWAKDSYYRFIVNCVTTGSNCGLNVASIAFYPNGGTEYSGYSTTCQAPVTIADPEFTIPSGKYTETQHVEITCETDDVTIYYTKDGSNPKDSETKQTYSTAVEIEEPGATLKAIATDGADHWSNVVTATYDVDKGYVASIAEFITRAPKDLYGLKWTDANSAYITAIKSEDDGKVSLYVQDASAGIMIYDVTLPDGAAVGKKMIGTIYGKHTAFRFQEELTNADFTEIIFSDATRPTAPEVTALDATTYAANPMKLVKLTNVKFQSTIVAESNTVKDASENEYIIYNTLGMLTGKVLPDDDVTCDVTGILVKFGYNTDNITYELLPVLVSDIDTKGAVAAAPIFEPAGAETLGAAEIAEGSEVSLSAATNCKINYGAEEGVTAATAYLTNKTGEGVTVTSTRDFYANNTVTRYFKADPTTIKFAINGLGTDAKGNNVQAKVDDEVVTNTYEGAEVTLIFALATHYTTTSATLDDEPLTITENTATFTMKGQAVTIATVFTEDAKATATFAAGGATSGSVESITKYLGEKFDLPSNGFTYDNHKFLGWKNDDNPVQQPGEEITMVEGGFTFTAQWQEKPNFANYDWKLVESSDDIAVGNYYVIASNANGAVAGDISNLIMEKKDATFSSDKTYLTLPEGAVILSLESAGNGNWYLINADTDKKLGATAEKKLAWDNGTMTWSIAMGDNGALTITNGTSSYGTLRYNSGSPRFTTYTSITMALPQFYMAVPKVYKITYNVNGGDDASKPEDTYANEQSKANVTAAVPTYTAHKFIGWKDASDNDYVAGQEVTLTADLELLAQWQVVSEHTLTYDANGGLLKPGKSAIEPAQVYEAVKFNVAENVYTIEGYVFDGWKYNNNIYNPGDEFEMPNGDVTFVAQWRNESDSKWHLVTNMAMLTDGSKIMIAAVNANQALGEIIGTNSYCSQVIATKAVDADHFNDNKLLISENSPVAFTLVKNEDGSFALKNGANYLSAQSSTGNNIKYSTTIDAMSSWTISIDENAVATIKTTGEAEKPYIQHNATATRFSCYGSTTQGAIAIYKEIDGNKAVREVSADTYTTFCIPQGVEVGNFYGATFWNIADKTFMIGDQRLSSITIEQAEGNLGAGVPYIMLADEETTEFVYYATGEAEEAGTNNGLVGVFDLTMFSSVESDEEAIERGIYIISDGTLYLCGNNCGVNAYRAYIQREQINYVAPNGAPRRVIGNPNVAPTTLNGIFGNQSIKAQKALIDGNIYILRDNKMYNAQGQFVK